jgi:signal transduction histidine kinase
MGGQRPAGVEGNVRLAVRLHDLAGDLAVGIGLLKGGMEAGSTEQKPGRVLEVFEQVLAELRDLSRAISEEARARSLPTSLRESLERGARTVGVDLDLRLTGNEDSLSAGQAELIRLAGREAIRNVKRHSGANHCRLTIDLSSCPFVVTARDWGAGIQPKARQGGGMSLLRALAAETGAALTISSQPGLGVELNLTGPRCVLTQSAGHPNRREDRPGSVVANESSSSRRRVAAKRPTRQSKQQIT